MYGDSQALFPDPSSIFPLSLKAKQGLTAKSKELFMASDASYSSTSEYGLVQNSQTDSGLLRFRSAPGSLFANLTEKSGVNGEGLPSRFSSSGAAKCSLVSQSASQALVDDNKGMINGYGVNSQLPPQYPRQSGAAQLGSIDGGYRVVSSMGMDHFNQGQPKMSSNLMRQNSSPAGLFSHLTSQNDYATLGGPGSYRVVNGSSGDLSPGSTRMKGRVNYSSGLSSSLGMLSRISEVANENGGAIEGDDEKLSTENGEAQFYSSGYSFGSWNDPANFRESFAGLKREVDGDEKSFTDSQNAELRRPPILSHHLSLPKSSAEMASVEKLLHFQDTVPCKIRAKRGFATHPRSIAERVRRTRISERMRKLQELVPNMDKQTNTADMLDLAVEYIKELQKQHKALTDIRAKCKCSSMQKPAPNITS